MKRELAKQAEQIESCIVCSMSKKISDERSQVFCTHGHDHTNYDPQDIKICDDFIRMLIEKGYCDEVRMAFRREFRDQKERREICKQMLVSATVNSFLIEENDDYFQKIDMIFYITILDSIDKGKHDLLKMQDNHNLTQMLHFLRKRIPCNCLDYLYQNRKERIPRMPRCNNEKCDAFTDKRKCWYAQSARAFSIVLRNAKLLIGQGTKKSAKI